MIDVSGQAVADNNNTLALAASSLLHSAAAASAVSAVCCRLKEPVWCRLSETGAGEDSFLVAGWKSSRYSVLTSWQPSPDLSDLALSS